MVRFYLLLDNTIYIIITIRIMYYNNTVIYLHNVAALTGDRLSRYLVAVSYIHIFSYPYYIPLPIAVVVYIFIYCVYIGTSRIHTRSIIIQYCTDN